MNRKTKKKMAYRLAVIITIVSIGAFIYITIDAFHWWATVILPGLIAFLVLMHWIGENI